ncbi:MAG: hypothetical protein II787_02890 [Lachnospiraceae bacterium]|nr:hypothetical protein [Lachnospiraceae bacterium]
MIILFLLLIVVPALLGCLIKRIAEPRPCSFGGEMSLLFCFVLGFIAMLVQFALLCYPASVLDTPFHILCLIICLVYAAECVIAVVLTARRRRGLSGIAARIGPWLRSPAFWLMTAFIAFQVIRLILQEPFEPRDSKTYNAIINDIAQTDHLFRNFPLTGEPVKSLSEIKLKYIMTPWYPFMSMLAVTSGLHPLIIAQTVMPAYVLILHYIVLGSLGSFLLDRKRVSDVCLFVFICAFLREITVTTSTPSIIELVWPAWGKGALAAIIVPAVLLLFSERYMPAGAHGSAKPSAAPAGRSLFVLILCAAAGCAMSTMSVMILPIELGLLGLAWAFRQRSVRPALYAACACIPALLYLAVYVVLSRM